MSQLYSFPPTLTSHLRALDYNLYSSIDTLYISWKVLPTYAFSNSSTCDTLCIQNDNMDEKELSIYYQSKNQISIIRQHII
ncbi:7614_t:CDS:2 [Racocetra fulgida]|uniref:7614_t:CDS:1 n=1 Tax=Racocetra fulgida TaxID=60492 RepID=A0A9N8VRN8_9GLOM|nr:7614_t:CDS:2 [Racocetra fulgida]